MAEKYVRTGFYNTCLLFVRISPLKNNTDFHRRNIVESKGMETLEEFIKRHEGNAEKSSSFVEYLYSLMDKYGHRNAADLYGKANISRQLYSSIVSGNSRPSLNVCLKLAFALGTSNHECKYLLKKAGYTLSSSNRFALIIRYAMENKIYDVHELNRLLEANGYSDSLIV